jgi:lipopolysaccharide export LptBFGC system permease protein LptF
MLPRFLLFLIPILTFVVPQRWFSFYATLMIAAVMYVIFMLTVLNEASIEAFAEFGVEVALGYALLNLALLGVRYWLIRRARARILKLPAPKDE